MHYSDQIRIKLDEKGEMVTISIRINEETVISKKVPIAEMHKFIAQFNALVNEIK